MARKDTEHEEQAALMQWACYQRLRWPELVLLHAIPNGGARHRAIAAKLKAEGVRAGVPDLCLPVPRAPWHGLYIEMKTTSGRTSEEQRRWIAALRHQGYRVEVCRGWVAARDVLIDYLTGGAEAGAALPGFLRPPQGATHYV